MEVSLIIPAHNESERLPGTLELYHESMREQFGDDLEIIVVANGCSDGTPQVARRVGVRLPQIRVIHIEEPVGKGGAVLEGFRAAAGRRILFADADGATAPGSLVELSDKLDHHDVVIGSRRLADSTVVRPQPLPRRTFGLVFAGVVRLLFGMPFKDTQAGAKAFRRAAARRLAQDVNEKHWTFDVDLLLSAEERDLDVHEHPVVWEDQEGSQLRFGSTAYQVLRSLLTMKLRRIAGRTARTARQRTPLEGHRKLREGRNAAAEG